MENHYFGYRNDKIIFQTVIKFTSKRAVFQANSLMKLYDH